MFNLQKKISDIEEQMDHTELKLKNKIEQLNVTSVTGEDSEREFLLNHYQYFIYIKNSIWIQEHVRH